MKTNTHLGSGSERVPPVRDQHLKITEIFCSLQGESAQIGWPTAFVRLTGCPLRCVYCDSEYAFFGGEWLHFEQILQQVADYAVQHVCVTGGEPLAQKRCKQLLSLLCDAGYRVSLETSGAIDLHDVDDRVSKVVDIKTPDSGEVGRNLWANLECLTTNDQLKFVICSRADYDWAKTQVQERGLNEYCQVWFSPSFSQIDPAKLADWVVADRLPVRFQLQLHKLLWGDQPGR